MKYINNSTTILDVKKRFFTGRLARDF
jgi:hypothetical protein